MRSGNKAGKNRRSLPHTSRTYFLDGQGVKLKAIMGMDGKMMLVTNRTKRIKKLSSMKERTIAISRHDTSDFLLDEIAK